ncbi:MAG: hypothetical protein ABIA63_08375, partial [bacterium]
MKKIIISTMLIFMFFCCLCPAAEADSAGKSEDKAKTSEEDAGLVRLAVLDFEAYNIETNIAREAAEHIRRGFEQTGLYRVIPVIEMKERLKGANYDKDLNKCKAEHCLYDL